MASITSAERLPERDYSRSHRTPPPIPSIAYSNTSASSPAPQSLHEPGKPAGYASESGSVRSGDSNGGEKRRGSLGSLLRRSSSNHSQLQHHHSNSTGSDIPPVPSVPPTTASASSSNRKISGEGRSMLRKSSKMRAAQEREKTEQERLAREHAPPPRLPSHNPLPTIDNFGGDNAQQQQQQQQQANSGAANFSRPGTNAYNSMPSSSYNSSSSPAYATRGAQASASPPHGRTNGEYVDAMERHESMAHRARYSYAHSMTSVNVSSPRRIRRRKDPTPFNVLIVGAKNSGKTSFISFLRHSLALPSSGQPSAEPDSTVNATKSTFTSHYLESDMDGERVGLTLWDSAGLEKNIVDLQLREMVAFVESKFEETFVEEQKVMRSPGVKDTHIHCVFLVLDPVRLDATVAASSAFQNGTNVNLANVSGLDDDLDLQVIRALWGKTTVIPIVSKADTLTSGHMSFLKRAVWHSIKEAKMDPLEALELEDDLEEEDEEEGDDEEDSTEIDDEDSDVLDSHTDNIRSKKNIHKRQSSLTSPSIKSTGADADTPYIPMSILSPDPYDLPPYAPRATPKSNKVGRRFPWGFADPHNAEHCDFTRLRDSIFAEWKGELRDLSRSKWYENWRTSRLKNLPGSKQRVKGGVTPIAAVPREGRNFSSAGSSGGANANMAVPRSVSSGGAAQVEAARPSKAERMMGIGAGEARNGAYQ